jgi:hypothetical protein
MPDSELQQGATEAKSSTDSWFGVQDARTRKTIQNRLAQRARRECFPQLELRDEIANVKTGQGQRLAKSKPSSEVSRPSRRERRAVELAPKVAQSLSSERGGVPSESVIHAPQEDAPQE